MREENIPQIQTINVAEARKSFAQLLNRVFRKESRVVVEKSGIPVAAIVSTDDLERLQRLDDERERGFQAMERISQAFADVPVEELERQVTIAVEQARAELRAEARAAAGRE
jgi:prevent-host-death family protein